MAIGTFPGMLQEGDHASRPAATAVGSGALYACSDHSLIYQSDGSSWSTWWTGNSAVADHNHTAAGGDGGDLDAPVIDGYAIFNEEAAPSTPSAGTVAIYAKSDGRIYSKDDAGNEYGPFDADSGGSAGPLLYVDSLALHADGDDFDDDTLTGWTLSGITIPTDVTAVTTEPYDDTCLDVILNAQGDRLYKAVPGSSNYEISLTIHGVTGAGRMPTLFFSDNSGNGTGISVYDTSNGVYLMAIASNAYSSTAATMVTGMDHDLATSNWPVVLKLKKVGTTLTGSLSFNGGLKWIIATRTDSTTFTRMGIMGIYTGGGSSASLRLGRFNVEEL